MHAIELSVPLADTSSQTVPTKLDAILRAGSFNLGDDAIFIRASKRVECRLPPGQPVIATIAVWPLTNCGQFVAAPEPHAVAPFVQPSQQIVHSVSRHTDAKELRLRFMCFGFEALDADWGSNAAPIHSEALWQPTA
jgi:hypothetical protein